MKVIRFFFSKDDSNLICVYKHFNVKMAKMVKIIRYIYIYLNLWNSIHINLQLSEICLALKDGT